MNEVQLKAVEFLAGVMGIQYPKFIQNLYYPDDYERINFSSIGDVREWEAMEVFHLDEDDFLCEIDDQEESFNSHGDSVVVDSDDIEYKYAFSWNGGDIGFYVLTMKNGTHYVGGFCGD